MEILGEPDQKEKMDEFFTYYLWENGKSGISFVRCVNTDLKKMKKAYGKDNVGTAKEGQSFGYENGKFVAKGKPTGDGEYIIVYANYVDVLSLNFDLKDGRVVSMGFSS